MIVVDTSVWIALFKRDLTPAVVKLQTIADESEILVADIVLLEVLQGARDDMHAKNLEKWLWSYSIGAALGESIAISAARNYRMLRGLALTISKTPGLILASYRIAEGHHLLQSDRDFMLFVKHLGLREY